MTPPTIASLRADTPHPIAILMYHQVGPQPERSSDFDSLVTSPERFANQMRLMHSLGWRGLSMTELEPYLRGERFGKVFGITFDDGYGGCFEHALPVLRYYGFSSTCFIVSDLVGETNAWDHGVGVPAQPLMNRRELKAWLASGQDLGAHTRTHPRLLRLDDATARDEIAGSKRALENMFGVEVRHFAYPFGEWAPQHMTMVREAGFETAGTSISRRASRWDALHTLPRRVVLSDASAARVWQQVAFGLEELRGRLKGSKSWAPTTPEPSGLAS